MEIDRDRHEERFSQFSRTGCSEKCNIKAYY